MLILLHMRLILILLHYSHHVWQEVAQIRSEQDVLIIVRLQSQVLPSRNIDHWGHNFRGGYTALAQQELTVKGEDGWMRGDIRMGG